MAHTHEFDCKICGEHLDSKQNLERHNGDMHAPKQGFGVSAPDASKPKDSYGRTASEIEKS